MEKMEICKMNQRIYDCGLFEAIGHTPIVKLNNLFPNAEYDINLYAKLEYLNPSGSAKDRSAYFIMRDAMEKGEIDRDTVIIESSSGNFGVALAQICHVWNLRFICVVDPKTTEQNLRMLKVLGAEVDCVKEPDKKTGEYLQARLSRVNQLLSIIPHSHQLNQYANLGNPEGHKNAAREIMDYFNDDIDYIFCPVSTCGTIRGYSEIVKSRNAHTKIIAVDAVGSVIFGDERKKRLIPGHGAAVVSKLFYKDIANGFIRVTDLECVYGCRNLLSLEGIFAGGSTGAAVSAIYKFINSNELDSGVNIIFPIYDRGDRYIENVYSDDWVFNNLHETIRVKKNIFTSAPNISCI